MATQSHELPPVRCWRLVAVTRCALAFGGLLLAVAPPLWADGPIHFVAPGSRTQQPVILAAAVEPVEQLVVPSATRLSAPVGQPRRNDAPIEFISPASRSVIPPFNLINPVESATPNPATKPTSESTPAATPEPVAVPTMVETLEAASPLATEIPGIPEFNFDDLLEAVSPTSVMQTAEEVAPPAASLPATGEPPTSGASPMDPLMYDSRKFRPITTVTVDAALPPGLAPGQPGAETKSPPMQPFPTIDDPRFFGAWPQSNYQWFATEFRHRPLYFEEVNVERYGYTISPVVQPVISGAHFFGTIAILPYKMTRHCPYECVYTLGHYRPGDCVPRRWHHELWDTKAAAVQGGVVTGLIFLIP